MTAIKAGAIAALFAVSFGALATSASAQPSRAERIAAAREARAEVPTYRTYRNYPRFESAASVYSVPNHTSSPGCYTQGNYGQGVDESACNQ